MTKKSQFCEECKYYEGSSTLPYGYCFRNESFDQRVSPTGHCRHFKGNTQYKLENLP